MKEKPKILVVDDDPVSLLLVAKLFSSGEDFEVVQAHDALEGMVFARKERPDLIISDYYMPGMDGFEFCRQVKKDPELLSTLFLLLSSETKESKKVAGFEEGVDDYIEKPYSVDLLKSKVKVLLRIKRLQDELRNEKEELAKANELLEKNLEELVSLLLQTLDVRIPGANDRAKRSRAAAEYIVSRLELPEAERKSVLLASLLHEVGKIGLPDGMIGRDWRIYTPEERGLFRQHPIIGAMMISTISGFRTFSNDIRYQFENYDGTGAPDGLQGDEIPMGARILRALVLHGMLLEKGCSKEEILQEIRSAGNRALDPRIANLLAEFIIENDQTFSLNHQKIPVADLRPGMVLAEDVYASSGIKLLPKGGRLQERTLQLLIGHHQADPIIGGVYVFLESFDQ